MTDTLDFLVRCIAADEADRALGVGFDVEGTPEGVLERREEAP